MNGPARIRVMVVDDHPLLREGIAAVLARQTDIELVAEAADGLEAIEQFRQHRPDVTLMDLQMPRMNGIDAIAAIRRDHPAARMVVLTTYKGDAQALRAIKAGATGYLLKSTLRKEMVETIRSVHAGRRHVPAEIACEIAEHVADDALSLREIDVLGRVAVGNTNREVARQLGISEETVKAHLKNLFAKLSAKDRTHAVMLALKRGILQI
ncbi:response regulator transcription factor [Solimonas marina]|uniref:Response regulator transcription factor n=1 Tax=Solimonas marina TaxID=2714601 RepID=A0A969WCS1_9GAMM|nr:response regulator transcription factor [Solimonas marina]NKF23026.1 response regulator transcription factor [Solimonas marina]